MFSLAIPAQLKFGDTDPAFFIEKPLVAFSKQFECSTYFQPLYHTHMKIINVLKNEIVPEDPTKPFYTVISARNLGEYNSKSSVTLHLKITALSQLAEDLICFQKDGFSYCHSRFACVGETFDINGVLYGHFDQAFMGLVLSYGIVRLCVLSLFSTESVVYVYHLLLRVHLKNNVNYEQINIGPKSNKFIESESKYKDIKLSLEVIMCVFVCSGVLDKRWIEKYNFDFDFDF